MDEESIEVSSGSRWPNRIFNALPLILAVAGYGAFIVLGFWAYHTPYSVAEVADDVTAAETREIAYWTKFAALSQLVAALAAGLAAIFAARAYREGQRSRIAAERQAAAAEGQTELARKQVRDAEFREIMAKQEKKIANARARSRNYAERDERAAANRAILVLNRTRLFRGDANGIFIRAAVELKNVGGSVALDVMLQFRVRLRLQGIEEQFETKNIQQIERALSPGSCQSFEMTVKEVIEAAKGSKVYEAALDKDLEFDLFLTAGWSDVHGYRIVQEYFCVADFPSDFDFTGEVAVHLVGEKITIGDRVVSPSE